MAQMKSVSIKMDMLKAAGYVVEKEENEIGTFYFISRQNGRIVEVLKRKEKLKKGKVIVMGSHMMHYCEAVKIEIDNQSLQLKCYNPSVTVKFI